MSLDRKSFFFVLFVVVAVLAAAVWWLGGEVSDQLGGSPTTGQRAFNGVAALGLILIAIYLASRAIVGAARQVHAAAMAHLFGCALLLLAIGAVIGVILYSIIRANLL